MLVVINDCMSAVQDEDEGDDDDEDTRKDRERRDRIEASLREREKEVRKTREDQSKEWHVSREQHRKEETLGGFTAFLTDMVRQMVSCDILCASHMQMSIWDRKRFPPHLH